MDLHLPRPKAEPLSMYNASVVAQVSIIRWNWEGQEHSNMTRPAYSKQENKRTARSLIQLSRLRASPSATRPITIAACNAYYNCARVAQRYTFFYILAAQGRNAMAFEHPVLALASRHTMHAGTYHVRVGIRHTVLGTSHDRKIAWSRVAGKRMRGLHMHFLCFRFT